eukprot:scaffold356083_cov52-Prasinocladus_malaysianus.AAC.1
MFSAEELAEATAGFAKHNLIGEGDITRFLVVLSLPPWRVWGGVQGRPQEPHTRGGQAAQPRQHAGDVLDPSS